MQTCSAALSSTATLIAYDLFKLHKPDISVRKLVVIGKWTTVLGTIRAIVASPLFGHYTTIFEGINKLISYVVPPITAVFLLGVFWKGASGKSAFITLIADIALGFVTFYLDWNNIYHGDFMLIAFLLLVVCLGIMMATSFMFPEALRPKAETLVWGNWIEPLLANCGSGLSDCRIISAVILVAFVVLYPVFH